MVVISSARSVFLIRAIFHERWVNMDFGGTSAKCYHRVIRSVSHRARVKGLLRDARHTAGCLRTASSGILELMSHRFRAHVLHKESDQSSRAPGNRVVTAS